MKTNDKNIEVNALLIFNIFYNVKYSIIFNIFYNVKYSMPRVDNFFNLLWMRLTSSTQDVQISEKIT